MRNAIASALTAALFCLSASAGCTRSASRVHEVADVPDRFAGAGELRRICPGATATTRYTASVDGQVAGNWISETPFTLVERSPDGQWILGKRSFDGAQAWVPTPAICILDSRRTVCGADSTGLFWADSPEQAAGRNISRGETVELLEFSRAGFAKIDWKGERFWMWQTYLCPVDPNVAPPLPATKNLDVPYLCQIDNANDPYGTCNNTSLAMVTGFYGHPADPDALFGVLGAATSLEKIQTVGRNAGFVVDIRRDANEATVKKLIASGRPVILGGFFSGGSGHFVVIRGYDQTGWFVNDPAGRWDGVLRSGYEGRWCSGGVGGANLHYSYESVRAAAGDGWWIAVPHL